MPYNGYAHNLQASPVEGSSRTYPSSPDSTSDSRGSSATGAGGCSQLVKRTVWFRGLLYGGEGLIAFSEGHATLFFWKRIIQFYPRSFRAYMEMLIDCSLGVRIERPEPKPENVRRVVLSLEYRRAATTRKAPMNTRARFPGRDQVLTRGQNEIRGSHPDRRSETRARMLSASPTMAVRDRAQQVATYLVVHFPTRTGAV
jgi:hypothetical protein